MSAKGFRLMIADCSNEELKGMLVDLRGKISGELKSGGKRKTALAEGAFSVSYSYDGIPYSAAYELVRSELVRRRCLDHVSTGEVYMPNFSAHPSYCDEPSCACACEVESECDCK